MVKMAVAIAERRRVEPSLSSRVYMQETNATYKNAEDHLRRNRKDLMTYKEAIKLLNDNPELKAALKGRTFWVKGEQGNERLLGRAGYRNIGADGEEHQGKTDKEDSFHVQPSLISSQRLILVRVYTDKEAAEMGTRYGVDGNNYKTVTASAIVGISRVAEVVKSYADKSQRYIDKMAA